MLLLPLELGTVLAAALYSIGLSALLLRRSILFTLIALEVMFNAAGVLFITAGAKWHSADGQVLFLFILAISAAEVAVGLSLVFLQDHHFKELETDILCTMRG